MTMLLANCNFISYEIFSHRKRTLLALVDNFDGSINYKPMRNTSRFFASLELTLSRRLCNTCHL